MYRVGNGQYLTLLIGAFCCIVLDNRWFSDFWPKDRCRVFFFFGKFRIKYYEHFPLGYRSCIERAVVLVKELIWNKRASSCMFRYNPVLEALIPGQLEKG